MRAVFHRPILASPQPDGERAGPAANLRFDGPLKAAGFQPGARVDVPEHLRLEVIDSAKECPGDCIHVVRGSDGVEVAGPEAED